MWGRLTWWGWFLLDVMLCLGLAVIVGIVFGTESFLEDVRFAWRRP